MFRKKTTSSPSTVQHASTSVTEAAPCRKAVQLRVGLEKIQPVRHVVLGEFQRASTLPGFRKGKAPTALVERHYHQAIHEETIQRVMKQTLEQVVTDHHLKPVGPIEVKTMTFSETDGLALEAMIEVEPTFPLGAYKGIPLTRPLVEVLPHEVDKALEQLRESMAQLVPTGEGQQKQRQVPPLDDELAKDMGLENLPALRAHVEAKVREQKQKVQHDTLEAALYDELLKRHTFDVPSQLVGRQTERLTQEFKARLLLAGMSEEQTGQELTKFTDQLRTNAQRHIKLTFILERIAEQESIAVTQEELLTHLWQLAQRWKKDPTEVRTLLDAKGLWPSVVSAIRHEKTMTWLLKAAVVQDASLGTGSETTHQSRETAPHHTGRGA